MRDEAERGARDEAERGAQDEERWRRTERGAGAAVSDFCVIHKYSYIQPINGHNIGIFGISRLEMECRI